MARGGKRPRGAVSKSHKRRKKMSLDKRIEKVLMKNQELKFVDTALAGAPVAIAGTWINEMTQVLEGLGQNQRIGKKIMVKKIMLRVDLHLSSTTAAGSSSDNIRILLVLVKSAPGQQVVAGDLLTNPSLINSFNNLQNTGAYVTLMDKYISFSAPSAGGSTATWGEQAKHFEWFKDMNLNIQYDTAAADLSSHSVISIQMFALTLSARIHLAGICRVRYTDS